LKFYVNETYDAETEMLESRDGDETRDVHKTCRDRLETETFETETTTLPLCTNNISNITQVNRC